MTSESSAITVNESAAQSGLTISWKDVGYAIKSKASKEPTTMLEGLSGCLKPGEILAVLGPSGAGKSTFLDVIAGIKAGTNGQVLLNGLERPMKKFSSYPCKVQDLLVQFGLVKCANSAVGDPFSRGISGGEKRRLFIVVQLVKEPRVIFLDEPTSGLDSSASFNVMETIKSLAKTKQCPVVCSIHQPSPSTYRLFDKVIFLAGRQTIYFGRNYGSEVEYFRKIGHEIPLYINVPDAVLDCELKVETF
ncbi:UNVERIFIED_CONTAM: hypothetical protein HDU68_012122 [Siphonaria sp. JEL0065]|nr:hypothetical protein HDU68_012122 [Siphonaria sp. JEL0065]